MADKKNDKTTAIVAPVVKLGALSGTTDIERMQSQLAWAEANKNMLRFAANPTKILPHGGRRPGNQQGAAHDVMALAFAQGELALSGTLIKARVGAILYLHGDAEKRGNASESAMNNVASHLNSLRTVSKFTVVIAGSEVQAIVPTGNVHASPLTIGSNSVAQWFIDMLIADKIANGELKAPKAQVIDKPAKKGAKK